MGDRRRTIQSNAPPPGVPSSIPRPSSSLVGRQSLASRPSLLPPQLANRNVVEPPLTASRANHMYMSASVSRNHPALSRASFAPQLAPDYVPPSERRISTYRRSTMGGIQGGMPLVPPQTPGSAAAAAISASTLARPLKDPREVRPKRAQERHADHILTFLSVNQCPFPLSLQNLLGPTSTHFSQLFGFLTKLFDPSINFGSPPVVKGQPKIKFEDEVLSTLRFVQYPFTDSITKSHLQSIGSMQSWPNMLAMLHWLVVVIEARQSAFESDPELHMPNPDFHHATTTDEVIPHAWFQFLQASYDKFINGEEDDSWQDDLVELKSYQDQATEVQRGRIEDLQGELESLEREWREMNQTEDPMVAFVNKKEEVQRDVARLNDYVVNMHKKNSGYVQTRKLLEQVIAESLDEREAKQRDQERLEQQVKAQKLTPFEITSLNAERQQLTKLLQDCSIRYRTVTEKKMSLEIDLERELDSVAKLCAEYESKATPLGILDGPVTVPGFEPEIVYFNQEVNGAAENPVPEGISTVVKPALQKLRSATRDEIRQLREAQVGLEEEMTRIREVLQEFGDVQAGLDVEFEAVDREKVDLNERIEREMHATNLELDRLQQQVHAASSTADHALLLATHRYDQRVLERRQVNQDTGAIRAANRAALESAMDSFMSYKEHMNTGTHKLMALMTEAEEDLKVKHATR
ncbi:uncharacterized protein JCM15063_001968 [Sporobolomyces koalae]|uniref:uncharacterized protein n=1 Tax=Sporobolomyces koalae TaxID=500713 RepID=UPI00317ECE74